MVVIYGPRAVGRSIISWGLRMDCSGRGEATAYLDADQLGFVHARPGIRDELILNAVVDMARSFARAGAERTIVNGNLSSDLITALAGPETVLVNVGAPLGVLVDRIAARKAGSPARLAGTTW